MMRRDAVETKQREEDAKEKNDNSKAELFVLSLTAAKSVQFISALDQPAGPKKASIVLITVHRKAENCGLLHAAA
jgi:hypothetical protein